MSPALLARWVFAPLLLWTGAAYAADDYGDAPDAGAGTAGGDYETIFSANGPRHVIVAGLFIGTTAPDEDPGVLRNATATADDVTGTADEGGLVTGTVLAVAINHTYDVTVTNLGATAATLYGWIDFDQNGSFDEDEFDSVAVPAGSNGITVTLDFTVPADVVSGSTFTRLRLTTETLASPADGGADERSLGPALDGEVEDQIIDVDDTTFDYGDAPDVYGTLAASNGPSHAVNPLLRLGLSTDAEADGQPTDDLAEGDDNLGSADEQGVRVLGSLSASDDDYSAKIRAVNSTGGDAFLYAWIDFDGSGSFDEGEFATATVSDGTNAEVTLNWSGLLALPITGGLTYARFRLTTDTLVAVGGGVDERALGAASDGEVEDYDLVIFGTELCEIDLDTNTFIPISPLDFQNPALFFGVDRQQGAKYRYSDVLTGVDAIVEIDDIQGVTIEQIDVTSTGLQEAFQPEIRLNSNPGTGYAEFVITLVKTGTEAPLEPAPAFLASAIDVDGDNDDLREFVEFYKPFGTVYREDPSLLGITDTGSYYNFIPANSNVNPGIDINATENIATLEYDGTAQFFYRAGSVNTDATGSARLNSLAFGCIEFNVVQDTTIDVDFGDAPANYPTLLIDFPALHTVVPGIGLGALVDAETEGQPDVDAEGDDSNGVDDEDAVTVGGQPLNGQELTPGDGVTFDVATAGTGLLSAWVDWDGNGSWEASERIANEVAGTGGTRAIPVNVPIAVTVPAGAAGGTTYARFRYTSDPGIDVDGGATDGEVEDYSIIIARLDYGDAPDAGIGTSRDDYTTLGATGGPAHDVPASPVTYLGTEPPDTDSGQLQAVDALADDAGTPDDEDGVLLAGDPLDDKTLFRGRDYDLEVVVTGPGYLNLWIDLNRDGDFDDTVAGVPEQVLDDSDLSANSGTNTVVVPVSIPTAAFVGPSYLRARFCDNGDTPDTCDTPAGTAPDGEVEDYRLLLAPITADAVIAGVVFEDNGFEDLTAGGIAHDGLVNGDEAGLEGVEVLLLFDVGGDGCDGTETVLAQTLTGGDGSYSLHPAQSDEGKTACIVVINPPGYRSISESDGGNPVVTGAPLDDTVTLTVPVAGTVWNDINFGDIRDPRLTPDRQDTVNPGGSVSYVHFYDATSDATVDFALGAITENPAGIGWADVLYRDADCSGDLTGTEPSDPVTGVPVLAGDRVCLLVRTFAPANAPPNALHARELTAATVFTATGGESAAALVTDITTVVDGQLRLLKSVRNIGPDGLVDTGDDVDLAPVTFNDASPGDVLRFLIQFRNEGQQPLRSLVLLDATPAFTSLAAPIACPGVLPPLLSNCTVATPDGTNAIGYQGALEWSFDSSLSPGAEGTIDFDVRIAQ